MNDRSLLLKPTQAHHAELVLASFCAQLATSRGEHLPQNPYFDTKRLVVFSSLFFCFANGSCQTSPSSALFPNAQCMKTNFLNTVLIVQAKDASTKTAAWRSSVDRQRQGRFSARDPVAMPRGSAGSQHTITTTARGERHRWGCQWFRSPREGGNLLCRLHTVPDIV